LFVVSSPWLRAVNHVKSALPACNYCFDLNIQEFPVLEAIPGRQLDEFLIGLYHLPFHGNDDIVVEQEIGGLLKIEKFLGGVPINPMGDL